MKKIFIIALSSFLFCFSLFGQDFGKAIKDDAVSLWSSSPDKFQKSFGSPEIYKWETALKKVLLYDLAEGKVKLYFLQKQISKASFKFSSKYLQGMALTLAKSAAQADKKTYLEEVKNLREQIKTLNNFAAPKVRKRKSRGWLRYTCSWKSTEYYISLKWAYSTNPKTPFKAGKIKLSVFRRISFAPKRGKKEKPEKMKSNSKIKTNDKGDRYLELKMVKQKSPEECIIACMERIFIYKEISTKSRLWKVSKKNVKLKVKGAKSLRRMFARIAHGWRCQVKRLATTADFDDFDAIIRFVRRYNLNAEQAGKEKINSFKTDSFDKLIKVMNEGVLLSTRNNPEKIENLKSKVCEEIDAGNPVLWIVFLGVVKETPEALSPPGGHVRLIVGYNSKDKELIYSDSWGKGHEFKKMKWNKAWAITLAALAVSVKE